MHQAPLYSCGAPMPLTDTEIVAKWDFLAMRHAYVIAGPNIRRIMVACMRYRIDTMHVVPVVDMASFQRARGASRDVIALFLDGTDPRVEYELRARFTSVMRLG